MAWPPGDNLFVTHEGEVRFDDITFLSSGRAPETARRFPRAVLIDPDRDMARMLWSVGGQLYAEPEVPRSALADVAKYIGSRDMPSLWLSILESHR